MGSSLPPPPPPSRHGRHRMHLKPRLPLEVSNDRYRDEHPNIWPDAVYCPRNDDYSRFNERIKTLDFYRGCNVALATLRRPEWESELSRNKFAFGKRVEEETTG